MRGIFFLRKPSGRLCSYKHFAPRGAKKPENGRGAITRDDERGRTLWHFDYQLASESEVRTLAALQILCGCL